VIFNGDSQAVNASRNTGHSPSMMDSQSVSRLRPFLVIA
jgi:hypothetical protein